ncbi:SDR family NAD(P)-dependent oxidoreductase [Nocardia alni]|uniref:SDR family NAD(P)-dependent oxidoreductase n=1 Tax=Nocardia alni TaxID=2815723 RepID=UPI001C2181BD|nr:SDR family NAD(P)-dependent oxidoreductase [Nocardia alni]
MTVESARNVAVVTGASAGIGKSTARMLAARGWQVIGVGRNPERSAAATAEINAAAREGGTFTMVRGDFTLMAEVKRVAAEIGDSTAHIDVLINNAGGVRDQRIVTAEGTEATFAANHLAPFLLTRELMPLLLESDSARVIAVSSAGHRMSRGLDWEDLQSLGNFRTGSAYCQAKLANILFTRELDRRAGQDGITAQAMHPGTVDSNFASHGDATMKAHMENKVDAVSPDEPAETLVWLATDPAAGDTGGRFFYRKAEEIPADPALDDAAAARLWIESEKLLATLGYPA